MVRGSSSCPKCQAPTAEGQAFCTSCGAQLAIAARRPPEVKSEAPARSGRAARKTRPIHNETLAGFKAAVDESRSVAPGAKGNVAAAPQRITPSPIRSDPPPNDAIDPAQPVRTRMYHSDSLQRSTGEERAPDTIGPRKLLQEHRAIVEPSAAGTPVTVVTEGVESSPPVDKSFAAEFPAPRPAPVADRWRQDAPLNTSSFFRYFDEVFTGQEGSSGAPPGYADPRAEPPAPGSPLRVRLPYWIAAIAATMAFSFEAVRLLQPMLDPTKAEGQTAPQPVWTRIEPDLSALEGDRPAIRWRIAAIPGTTLSIDGHPVALGSDGRAIYATDISDDCTGPALAEVKMEKAIRYVAQRAEGAAQEDTVSVMVSIVPLELKQVRPQSGGAGEMLLKGRTAPDARLTIQGTPVPLAGGSFEKKVSVKEDVSEVVVRASRTGNAPRVVRIPIDRGKSSEGSRNP